jgi:hypothetical protein
MAERGPYQYRDDVLAELPQYGITPTSHTPPQLAREFVADLYRHQLRQLRQRLLDQEFPRHEYAGRVEALRLRYRVLSLRPREWLVREDVAPPAT